MLLAMDKTWTKSLITALFTAAAAWGSVTVEIRQAVDNRAAITESRLEGVIRDRTDAAVAHLQAEAVAQLDSVREAITNLAETTSHNRTVTVVQQVPLAQDSATLAALETTNERLRYVAIALGQLRADVATLQQLNGTRHRPKYESPAPYGK